MKGVFNGANISRQASCVRVAGLRCRAALTKFDPVTYGSTETFGEMPYLAHLTCAHYSIRLLGGRAGTKRCSYSVCDATEPYKNQDVQPSSTYTWSIFELGLVCETHDFGLE